MSPDQINSAPVSRRRFALTSLMAAAGVAGCAHRSAARGGVLVNDVHSRLNPTRVRELRSAVSLDQLTEAVREARDGRMAVCVAGGRHAMGAQQFATGAVMVDTRKLARVLDFDRSHGTIEVESGIQWPELVKFLLEAQGDEEGIWTIAQKQTGADKLSIGGALAANIHGRGLSMKPFIANVEAFTLVDAEGRSVRCSRRENEELFGLVAGGYGLFGLVYSVKLRLVRRMRLRRVVELLDVSRLAAAFERRIAAGHLFGDFQFAIDPASDDFLRKGIFSCYEPAPTGSGKPSARKLQRENWADLIRLAHLEPSQAFRAYADYYLATSGQIYWSDLHQFSTYLDDYHRPLDRHLNRGVPSSEIISELYVPRPRLASFMAEAADDFRRHGVKVIYGTIRIIERDDDSFLAWAREPYACVIFNLCTTHSPEGIEHSAAAFRRLIGMAARRGGSYYLTYHKFATREQVEACHPRFQEFLRRKTRFDPGELFQSDWYRHHRWLLASR